ncbi:MAG: calcium/sodium antiporter [Candidatus Moranbacteria bacterium]|nr:calcium/sodium antiporter [Candidatus Moranbacteria bacterium]
MQVLVWISVFIVGLAVLIKASDYFTDAAEVVGKYFKLPAFIIGVTIVALGTSLPEMMSSVMAVISGSSEIVIGNVIGSNIANIFLVLGLTAVICKGIKAYYELVRVDLPLLMASSFFLAAAIWDGNFHWVEAILSLAGVTVYILYTISSGEKKKDSEIQKKIQDGKKPEKLHWKYILILVSSAIFIFLGAKYTINSVIQLSQILQIGTEVIAISAVALGTSLPELAVSIKAATKGKAEIALGNILGSNIFNSFAVMGVAGLFGNLFIPEQILTFGLPMMLMATFLYFFMAQDREITKWEGSLLVIFYVFFIGKTFNLF